MTSTKSTYLPPPPGDPAGGGPGEPGDPGTRPWRLGAVGAGASGIIAVGLAIGVAELVAALGAWFGAFSVSASPLSALGSAFIALTPEWLKQFAISSFGPRDKDALRVGMAVTLLIVAAVIGVIGRRSPRWAAGVYVVLVAVTAAAVLTRSGAGAADVIATLAGGAAGLALLVAVLRRALGMPPDVGGDRADAAGGLTSADTVRPAARANSRGVDRRQFFRLAGVGAVLAAGAGALSRWVPSAAAVVASRAAVDLPPVTDAQPVADVDLKIPGLTPFRTPDSDFYRVDTAFVLPRVTADAWRLKIHGLVSNPLDVDFAQLSAMPQVERMITLCCVSNEVGGNLVGNASWQGVRIADLLATAGPTQGADCVLSTSADGFTVTTPLQALTDGRDALLATGMNGAPLPLEHGFPVRMVVPGLYGYVSATKWVVDLEVTKFAEVSAYWTERGWSPKGPVKTQSRIDVPDGSSAVRAGTVAVAGVAWAQHRGITAVQVRVDDGPWQATELSAPVSVDTWRQWVYRWDAPPGDHTIRCRAVDGTGTVQTQAEQDVVPDGATGYDAVQVTVRA